MLARGIAACAAALVVLTAPAARGQVPGITLADALRRAAELNPDLERGCATVSVIEVRGVSPGLRREEYSFSISLAQPVEPMAKLEIVGGDADVGDWADLIAGTASTGALGDGMVFVTPVETAIRIGTGARGDAALPAPRTPS